jgi:hypothetical protein
MIGTPGAPTAACGRLCAPGYHERFGALIPLPSTSAVGSRARTLDGQLRPYNCPNSREARANPVELGRHPSLRHSTDLQPERVISRLRTYCFTRERALVRNQPCPAPNVRPSLACRDPVSGRWRYPISGALGPGAAGCPWLSRQHWLAVRECGPHEHHAVGLERRHRVVER